MVNGAKAKTFRRDHETTDEITRKLRQPYPKCEDGKKTPGATGR